MGEPDKKFKEAIAEFLTCLGLKVSDIPRTNAKTPDLIIEEGAPDATLIEIKQKTHDDEELEAFFASKDSNGVATRSRPTGRRNRLAAIITKGVQQLVAKDPTRSMLRVIWFHCEGYDAGLHELQLMATVYGTQKLFSSDHPDLITGYYFWDSSFFRHRNDLDAVIKSKGNEAQMMLNEYSPKFAEIKNSSLARAFGPGIFYPRQYQLSDGVAVCDHSEPRETEESSLAHLREKYGLSHLQTMNMGLHEGVAQVQNPESDPN